MKSRAGPIRVPPKGADERKCEEMERRASQLAGAGRHGEAFKLFRRLAMQDNAFGLFSVGYCYDVGEGVKRSPDRALLWYRRAFAKHPDWIPAHNIGTIYRDLGRPRLALRWFQKSIELGGEDSRFEIAKLYLGPLEDRLAARKTLEGLLRRPIYLDFPETIEDARALLEKMDQEEERDGSRQRRDFSGSKRQVARARRAR